MRELRPGPPRSTRSGRSGSDVYGRAAPTIGLPVADIIRPARDDAVAMHYLIPGWAFDRKRPCLVR
jgi:hypothetical protein